MSIRQVVKIAAIILSITFSGWLFLFSRQIGSEMTIAQVHGRSMEPVYHSGDLVIVHKADSYQTGDVIVYYNQSLERYVIHRIIDQTDGVYTLKGDHNAWIDGEHPSNSSILGKTWLHLPASANSLKPPPELLAFSSGLGQLIAGILLSRRF